MKILTIEDLEFEIAFNSLEPIDSPWSRNAQLCASIFNASGNVKEWVDAKKFMPNYKEIEYTNEALEAGFDILFGCTHLELPID